MSRAPREVALSDPYAVYEVQREIRETIAAAGGSSELSARARLVATELATNVIRHGGGGRILLWVDASSVEMRVRNPGAHPLDLGTARRDGWSEGSQLDPAALWKREGRGAGLGAVYRLAEHVAYSHVDGEHEFHVICRDRRTRR